jgi:hypothetical protein
VWTKDTHDVVELPHAQLWAAKEQEGKVKFKVGNPKKGEKLLITPVIGDTSSPVYVQRQYAYSSELLPLDSLVPGNSMVESLPWILLDTTQVPLYPGDSLVLEVQTFLGDTAILMRYTVADSLLNPVSEFITEVEISGTPPYNVTIANISDVGNDQGKQVRIKWTSFPGDDPSVTDFTIFRRIDTLLSAPPKDAQQAFPIMDYPPGEWDIVGTYQAFGETLYSAVVPTLKDSTIAQGMYWSAFFIRAGTNNPIVYFDSPVDSGYSLDNLSPSPPTGLFASHAPASTKLIWHTTPITDFDYHTVYRDTISEFPPSLSNRVGFTIDTTFRDSTAQLGRTYYYIVTATDFSGNESDPSNEAIGIRYITGDANRDGKINASDVVYLINYLFIHGPAPVPLEAGDANCDAKISASDVVFLINYLFISGPPPGC